MFFADGTRAGQLGDVSDDSFAVERDDGTVLVLLKAAFDRTERKGVVLGCEEHNVAGHSIR